MLDNEIYLTPDFRGETVNRTDDVDKSADLFDVSTTEDPVEAGGFDVGMAETYSYALTPDEAVSATIVRLVQQLSAVDLANSPARLGDAVDPDALDALFPPGRESRAATARFEFELWGCRMVVTEDRTVTIGVKREP